MGPKTLTTIWGTYMKLVIKQDVARYVVLRIPLLLEEMILYLICGFGMVTCTVSPLSRLTAHLLPVYCAT
jgi:hypothetical protein